MCFSATASFGVGAAVTAIGVATLKEVQTPSQVAFGVFPLLFGIQQFSEGLVWLSLSNPDFIDLQKPAVYSFLLFALVLWPALVPAAVLLFDTRVKTRGLLYGLQVIGIGVSLYLLYSLFICPIDVRIEKHHILYDIAFRESPAIFYSGLYFVATVVPLLISSVKGIRWYGVSTAVSYGVTKVLLAAFVISIWCFFAAALSVMIYFIVRQYTRVGQQDRKVATVW